MTSTFDVLAQVCVLIEKKIKSGGHTGEFVFRLALRGRSIGVGAWRKGVGEVAGSLALFSASVPV